MEHLAAIRIIHIVPATLNNCNIRVNRFSIRLFRKKIYRQKRAFYIYHCYDYAQYVFIHALFNNSNKSKDFEAGRRQQEFYGRRLYSKNNTGLYGN